MRRRAATYTGFASPGCAAPSAFLKLLALCSTRPGPALFRAGNAHGFFTFRGFPPPVAGPPLDDPRPSCRFHVRKESALERAETTAARGSRVLECIRWIRSRGPVLPGDPRPILSWRFPFEVLTLRASAPCFHGTSSHGLRYIARRLPAYRHTCSTECQRTAGRRVLFRERPPSVRFVSSKSV